MKINKIIIVILCIILIVSLASCGAMDLVSTEAKEVNAFVTEIYCGVRGYFVTVEYDGARNQWNN